MGNLRGHLWAIGLLLLLPSSTVIANDFGAHKLATMALRNWVLSETAEGKVFSRLLTAIDSPLRLKPKSLRAVDAALDSQLTHIERDYLQRSGHESFIQPKSVADKKLLADIAAEHLGGSKLFEPTKTIGLDKGATTKRNADKFSTFWKDLRSCKSQMSQAELKKQNLKYMLTQLGIDEMMTFAGAVIASGSQPVEWANLPTDLAFEAMASLGGSKLISLNSTFMMGWVRLAGFGAGQSVIDATVYYLMPMKELNGNSETQATLERFVFNTSWNTLYAPIHIGMYHLLTSLECLLQGKGGGTIVLGLQLGSELGTNVSYFGIRNSFLQDPE